MNPNIATASLSEADLQKLKNSLRQLSDNRDIVPGTLERSIVISHDDVEVNLTITSNEVDETSGRTFDTLGEIIKSENGFVHVLIADQTGGLGGVQRQIERTLGLSGSQLDVGALEGFRELTEWMKGRGIDRNVWFNGTSEEHAWSNVERQLEEIVRKYALYLLRKVIERAKEQKEAEITQGCALASLRFNQKEYAHTHLEAFKAHVGEFRQHHYDDEAWPVPAWSTIEIELETIAKMETIDQIEAYLDHYMGTGQFEDEIATFYRDYDARVQPEDMDDDEVLRLVLEFDAILNSYGFIGSLETDDTLASMNEDPKYLQRFKDRARQIMRERIDARDLDRRISRARPVADGGDPWDENLLARGSS